MGILFTRRKVDDDKISIRGKIGKLDLMSFNCKSLDPTIFSDFKLLNSPSCSGQISKVVIFDSIHIFLKSLSKYGFCMGIYDLRNFFNTRSVFFVCFRKKLLDRIKTCIFDLGQRYLFLNTRADFLSNLEIKKLSGLNKVRD